ncbi:hypothetical protein OCU04_008855 [Sclerotinia nivalis]|uniref:Methylated-DNA-[protein]-cysteine S-methyltransferase DNA binding domain-containing protein n=1 Tax=Sclerotinia nivalis TaxID=352851 RepID=A0A9X0AJW8_9HELO|nr:hypothetical protein OCU04_008855 [Sclerotinia nivalis]
MPRTDEAEAFYHSVYSAIQEIPYGKVTSYGHIARLIGTPQRPRQVGICLKHLPTDPSLPFHNGNVPWHRVINSKGMISPRYIFFFLFLFSLLPTSHLPIPPHIYMHTHLQPPKPRHKQLTTPHPKRGHPSGAQNQATALRSEGITVTTGSLGELTISLTTYGWFPRQLPSEEAAGLDVPIDSNSDSDSDS